MKEYVIRFSIEGFGSSESFVTVEDGTFNTASAEEQFYSFLRKNEKVIIRDAEDEERDQIINNLTSAQEVTLAEECMKTYHGDKEHWEYSYEAWLEELSTSELKTILHGKDLIDLQKFVQREKEDMQN